MQEKRARINRRIRAPELRLIDEDGSQVGILNLAAALALADEKGLDLVEVSPNAQPPVCRVMDYGKFLYEQRKRQRESHKGQPGSVVKEIKVSAKIEEHDINFKIVHIKKFLAQKFRVKVTVVFRGREVSHSELGRKVLDDIIQQLNSFGLVESEPRLEGKTMWMLLAPVKKPGKGDEKPLAKAEG